MASKKTLITILVRGYSKGKFDIKKSYIQYGDLQISLFELIGEIPAITKLPSEKEMKLQEESEYEAH